MDKHTILLVDDEQNILNSLVRLLRKEGYKILTANSGNEGIEVLKREQVSLIISDQRMPGMNGVDFFKQVKKLYSGTIRIILSGYTEVNSIVSAINEGEVYKFITKPWNDEELKVGIRRALEQFDLKNENNVLLEKIKKYNKDLEKKVEERTRDLRIRNRALMLSQAILENLSVAVVGINEDRTISMINSIVKRFIKSGSDPFLGSNIYNVFPEEMAKLVDKTLQLNKKQTSEELEINNNIFNVECTPLTLQSGSIGAILLITNRQEVTEYKLMINASRDYITLVDKDYIYREANDAYLEARKKSRCKVLNRTVADVWGEDIFLEFIKNKFDACFRGETVSCKSAYEFKDGELNHIETTYYPCHNINGDITHAVVISHNVTEIKQSEENTRYMGYHDNLTKLSNRVSFMEFLEGEIVKAKEKGQLIAVLFLDLDRFKEVNNTFGHIIGDKLLVSVAQRLKVNLCENISPVNTANKNIFRLCGDEFTIIISDIKNTDFCTEIAEKVISIFKEPFIIEGNELEMTASTGIAVYPDTGKNIDMLLNNADTAMRKAKEKNGTSYHISLAGE